MKKLIGLLALCFIACIAPLYSQSFGRGDVFDKKIYEQLPQKARQVSRAYQSLPPRISLKQYAPEVRSQGAYGTCVGWSTAYAARTIAESIALNRTSAAQTTDNAFSPVFAYKSISDDPTCQNGIYIHLVLELMKTEGAAKIHAIEKTTDFADVPLALFSTQRKFTIADFSTLISYSDDISVSNVDAVKKSLVEKKPVIVSLKCPASFNAAKDVWAPQEAPKEGEGAHAMCIVGYDDEIAGGSFELLNSWGADWGNEGYIWVSYSTFIKFVNGAYEISDNIANYGKANQFSGNVKIALYTQKDMRVSYKNAYYETADSYPAGTRFRYLMSNNESAYVYAFAADDSLNPATPVFPDNDTNRGLKVSPLLDYTENTVVFPGERKWIQLDDTSGTDYLVVLYAKEALDIDAIRKRFDRTSGSFPEKVAEAVGTNFIPFSKAAYSPNEMNFKAESANMKAVFALLLAIKHG